MFWLPIAGGVILAFAASAAIGTLIGKCIVYADHRQAKPDPCVFKCGGFCPGTLECRQGNKGWPYG